MTQITSAQEAKQRVEERRYRYFTFPTLEITVKYRKPDLLKLSFNRALPAVMADMIIQSYKEAASGATQEQLQKGLESKNLDVDEKTLKELSERGYDLMKTLVVSHHILDVPESDFDNNVLCWLDIPEEDAIAFLMNLIQDAQTHRTASGGEITSTEVSSFPARRRLAKRGDNS